jgi:environmental stress-induced protein Ves
MRKLDPAKYRTMSWKNGGGTTTEALTLPADAGLDDFELRISMARVAASGPFSQFHGVDRTLVVTDGAGLTLETADGARVTLDRDSAPFSFTGDDPVNATLVDGPVTDFNVMTRRKALRHEVRRLSLDADEARTFVCSGELALLLVLSGTAVARGDVDLSAGDILTVTPEDGQVVIEVAMDTSARPPGWLVVDFFRR